MRSCAKLWQVPDFAQFLEYIDQGADAQDAAALVGVMPEEFEAWLDEEPTRRRLLATAEAKFRLKMIRVLTDAAEVKRSVGAASHFLKRKTPERAQMSLDFSAGRLTLDMPDNSMLRTPEDK